MKPKKNHTTEKTHNAGSAPMKEYEYKQAGIRVRSGLIPLWLILVAIGLIVWGIYYIIQFWNPPK